jgi:hypothetical protein
MGNLQFTSDATGEEIFDFSVKCQTNVSFKATVLILTLKIVFDIGKVYGCLFQKKW